MLVLTLWVFVCAFNRGSATYGEVAVSAALTVRTNVLHRTTTGGFGLVHTPPTNKSKPNQTNPQQAPIVVVGPVVGSSGAVVRISQVILGTVIYVITDNLFFPVVRAFSGFFIGCMDGSLRLNPSK